VEIVRAWCCLAAPDRPPAEPDAPAAPTVLAVTACAAATAAARLEDAEPTSCAVTTTDAELV
jgi:hypothetical protein